MYGREKKEMMVYVILGMLEAGKTSLIKDLLEDELFEDKSKTLSMTRRFSQRQGRLVSSWRTRLLFAER